MGICDGRVAIVTGAGRGIGREHALLMAAQGASVVVNDLGGAADGTGHSETAAQKVVDEIKAAGGEAVANYDSVATPEGGANIVKTAVDTFGRIDIIINNAGILRRAPATDYAAEDWEATLSIGLSAAFYLSQAAARSFLAAGNGGKIVNLASILSFQGGVCVPADAGGWGAPDRQACRGELFGREVAHRGFGAGN